MATEYDEDLTPLTGADLRGIRQQRGVGQGELERLLGLKKSTLRHHESRPDRVLPSPYRELALRLRDEDTWQRGLTDWFQDHQRRARAQHPRRIDILDLETDIELSEQGAAHTTQTRLILRAKDDDIRGVPIGRLPIDDEESFTLTAFDGGLPGRQKLDRWTQEYYLRFAHPMSKGQTHVVTYVLSPPVESHQYVVWSTELWRIRRCTLLLWVPENLRASLLARPLPRQETGRPRQTSRRLALALKPSANGLIVLGPLRPEVGASVGLSWRVD